MSAINSIVNEETFRWPLSNSARDLDKPPALMRNLFVPRHKSNRFGTDLDCNLPLFNLVTARLLFLFSQILSELELNLLKNSNFLCVFTIIYCYYSVVLIECQLIRGYVAFKRRHTSTCSVSLVSNSRYLSPNCFNSAHSVSNSKLGTRIFRRSSILAMTAPRLLPLIIISAS